LKGAARARLHRHVALGRRGGWRLRKGGACDAQGGEADKEGFRGQDFTQAQDRGDSKACLGSTTPSRRADMLSPMEAPMDDDRGNPALTVVILIAVALAAAVLLVNLHALTARF
jgi:hypothetical protein